jgi:putative MATE family efflux protein
MGASPEVIAQGIGYTRMMLGGNAAILLLFLANSIFRGAGDGAVSMRALWLANGINILLGPCLIFGLGPFHAFGVRGAAIATTIGRGTGALYGLVRLFGGKARVRIERRHYKLQPSIMIKLLRLSSSAIFQVFIGTASWMGIMRVLSTFGSQAVAGYTIGIRVVLFALFPAFGMGSAAATMVGQCLGAGKPDRAERAVWMAGFYNMCFLGSVGLLFVLFTNPIIAIFTHDPLVAESASNCLRFLAFGFMFYAFGMVLTQSFNGAGDTWTPTLLNFFIFWCWEIPLAYFLAVPMGFGPRGVFIAIPISFSTLALVSAFIFRKGKWKTRVV